jgi:hypothetical protein
MSRRLATSRRGRHAVAVGAGFAAVLLIAGGEWVAALVLAALMAAILGRQRASGPARVAVAAVSRETTLDFEDAFGRLLGMVGAEVRVLVAPIADGWGAATLRGTLGRAGPVGPADDETLFFAVGTEAGFFMPRARFRRAEPVEQPGRVGLALYVGEAVLWVLDDQACQLSQLTDRDVRGERS